MTSHKGDILRQQGDIEELFARMERLRDGNARLHASQRETVRTLERTCRNHDALLRAMASIEAYRREQAMSLGATGDQYQAACAAAVAEQLAELLHRFGKDAVGSTP